MSDHVVCSQLLCDRVVTIDPGYPEGVVTPVCARCVVELLVTHGQPVELLGDPDTINVYDLAPFDDHAYTARVVTIYYPDGRQVTTNRLRTLGVVSFAAFRRLRREGKRYPIVSTPHTPLGVKR